MTRIIILYAPDDPAMRKISDQVQKAFDKKQYHITIKNAQRSSIAEIAASQAVIFGSRGNSAVPIHSDYQELVRAFSGVNLAGKSAAIVMEKETETFMEFSAVLKDSEISIFDEPLFLTVQHSENTEIARWVKKYCAFIKEHAYE